MAEPPPPGTGGRGRRGRRGAGAEPFAAPLPHDDAWIDTLREDPDSAGDDASVAPPWAGAISDQNEIILALSLRVDALESAVRELKAPSPPAAPRAPTARDLVVDVRRRLERVAGGLARRRRRS